MGFLYAYGQGCGATGQDCGKYDAVWVDDWVRVCDCDTFAGDDVGECVAEVRECHRVLVCVELYVTCIDCVDELTYVELEAVVVDSGEE